MGIPPDLPNSFEDDEVTRDRKQEEEEAELHKKLNDSLPEAEEYFDNPEVRFESIKQRDTLKRWQMNNSLMTKGYA